MKKTNHPLGKFPDYYNKITLIILSFLIIVLFISLIGGIVKSLFELRTILQDPVEVVVRHIIINTLIILALVEVLKTALSYFTEGRVRVTYIIDTVLIVVLNELMSAWFKSENIITFMILIISIFTLIFARVVAIRFSPSNPED